MSSARGFIVPALAALLALAGSAARAGMTYITEWGSFGNGPTQFNFPTGITLGPDGNVYVSDGGNSRVTRFTPDGQFVQSWGSNGSANGQFRNPHHMMFHPINGDLYVTDKFNYRVQRFTPDGQFVLTWGSFGQTPGKFLVPWGIHIDPAGNVYVVSRDDPRVQKFTENGVYLTEWGTAGTGAGQFQKPHEIITDPDGNIYVSDVMRHDVQKFDSSFNHLLQWGAPGSLPGQFLHPHELVWLDGQMIVLDWLEHPHGGRLQSFTPDGVLIDIVMQGSQGTGPLEFNEISGVAYEGDGVWYLIEWGNHRVQKIVATGLGLGAEPLPAGPRPAGLGRPVPNPTASFSRLDLSLPADARGRYGVSIVDVRGRRVLRQELQAPLPDGAQLAWDGADDAGLPVVPGVYFLTVSGEGFQETRRIVRVR